MTTTETHAPDGRVRLIRIPVGTVHMANCRAVGGTDRIDAQDWYMPTLGEFVALRDGSGGPWRDCCSGTARGEAHTLMRSRIEVESAELAEQVRARYEAGGVTHEQLAVEYGVSQPTITRWISGQVTPKRRRPAPDARFSDEALADLTLMMQVRNKALEMAALCVQPGPDGQDYLDRSRMVREWIAEAYEELGIPDEEPPAPTYPQPRPSLDAMADDHLSHPDGDTAP